MPLVKAKISHEISLYRDQTFSIDRTHHELWEIVVEIILKLNQQKFLDFLWQPKRSQPYDAPCYLNDAPWTLCALPYDAPWTISLNASCSLLYDTPWTISLNDLAHLCCYRANLTKISHHAFSNSLNFLIFFGKNFSDLHCLAYALATDVSLTCWAIGTLQPIFQQPATPRTRNWGCSCDWKTTVTSKLLRVDSPDGIVLVGADFKQILVPLVIV